MVAYMNEFLPGSMQDVFCTVLNMADACVLILQTFYYKNYSYWLPLHKFYFFVSCGLILIIMTFPESPKFNYVKKRYAAVRRTLQTVAWVNGVRGSKDVFRNTVFEMEANDGNITVQEIEKQTIVSVHTTACKEHALELSKLAQIQPKTSTMNGDSASPNKTMMNSVANRSIISEEVVVLKGNLSEICTVSEIRTNFITLMLVFSLGSFTFFCLNFLMKNIQGNMFDNTLASQASEVAADFLSGVIFICVGARFSLSISFLVSLVGLVLLL